MRRGRTDRSPRAYGPLAAGVRTARRGRTNRSPWAYEPLAAGVRTARRGRTNRSPRAYEPLAVGVRTARHGHNHGAPWACSPRAVGVLATPRAYSPRSTIALRRCLRPENCPIEHEKAHGRAPEPTPGAPRSCARQQCSAQTLDHPTRTERLEKKPKAPVTAAPRAPSE